MKILFIKTQESEETNAKYCSAIVEFFHKRSVMLQQSTVDKSMKLGDIEKQVFKVDAVVIESSFEKIELGQVAVLALMHNKLALLVSKSSQYGSKIEDNRLITKHYRDSKDLEFILNNFMETVEALRFTKFNFIISSELNDYLEWNTLRKKKSKSEIAREAIQRSMLSDKEYLSYLQKVGGASMG